jgi:ribosome assembly protein YihI (activator of Der GTPase)
VKDAHVADARMRGAWRTRQLVSLLEMTRVIAEEEQDYDAGVDRMDEMLESMQVEVTDDPPTAEVETFFKLLKASEEPLYEQTEVILLAFIT